MIAVFIAARAANGDAADLSGITIATALTSYSLGSLVDDSHAGYLGVTAAELVQGCTLVAKSTLQDGNQSLPAYQLNVCLATIPLTAGIGLLGSALGLLAAVSRAC